jgi:fructose-1,6-bisphosphatase II
VEESEVSEDTRPLDRNLALELMRVTEAGALAAGRAIGRGDPDLADRLAVEAVRRTLDSLPIDGVVVVGEGEGRGAERMYLGERLGSAEEPHMDVAVDPIDGTDLVASGAPGAICTVALAPRSTLFRTHVPYMERIVVGGPAAGAIDITAPIGQNLRAIASKLQRPVSGLTVVMLERPRHEQLAHEVRATGATVTLIPDGDVAAAVLAALPEEGGADVLIGIGGAPEAALTACAVLCLGGDMQARLWLDDDAHRAQAEREGIEPGRVFSAQDLCRGGADVYMSITGITPGELLRGVRFRAPYATTQSLVMRSLTGTARRVESTHDLRRLAGVVGSAFDPLGGDQT